MEEVQSRHRKEQRELQARITQRKKNATKKTRKGINDECEVLQRELGERHKAELATLSTGGVADDMQHLSVNETTSNVDDADKTGANSPTDEDTQSEPNLSTPSPDTASLQARTNKPNRHKARLARRAAEQEAQAARAAEEAANLPDLREQELKGMQTHMDKLGLTEVSIRPDGHCLYSAVANGLPEGAVPKQASGTAPYQFIRNRTSAFISEHPDDFAAFLEEPLDQYVHKIRDTAEWGGQLELQAIARSFSVAVHVLQSDGRVEEFEPESQPKYDPVWLAYYRHSFGLGEHYNALSKDK